MNTKSARIPSLDGLRALAIILVMLDHFVAVEYGHEARWAIVVRAFGVFGHDGVIIFFVLSGFLITRLILDETEARGRFDLAHFYHRRCLRIVPAFYAYLVVLALLIASGLVVVDWSKLALSALFLWNAGAALLPLRPDDWFLAQFWSLALEIQFYLLWPLLLTGLGRQRAYKAVPGLIALIVMLRVAHYWAWPAARPYLSLSLHTGGDPLLFGCLIAVSEETSEFARFAARLTAKHAFAAFLWLTTINPVLYRALGPGYKAAGGTLLNAFAIALLFVWIVHRRPKVVERVLNAPALVYIGVLSYSIYVWSTFFFTRFPRPWSPGGLYGILLMFGAALLSQHLVERQFYARRGGTGRARLWPGVTLP